MDLGGMKLGNDFSDKEQHSYHWSACDRYGMDHGWYLQIAEYLWNSEYRSLYCHLQYPYLCSYDPTADQTAEIL